MHQNYVTAVGWWQFRKRLRKRHTRIMSEPEVESRTQGSRPRPRTQKNPRSRPRIALPRTNILEANDTGSSVLQKKGLQNFFSGDLQRKKTKKVFANFPRGFWRFPTKFKQFKKRCCPQAQDRVIFEDLRPRGQGLQNVSLRMFSKSRTFSRTPLLVWTLLFLFYIIDCCLEATWCSKKVF